MANTIKLKRASGSDPGNSDLSVGELAIRTSNCKLFSKNDAGSAVGIVAGSADTLTTARTIAGVSFDGSANISLNNNAITNGAGYITATLTQEQVEDYVGGMVSGNTETGITVTYDDSDGTLDFVVASQTENDFTTTLKNKLDGIAAGAIANVVEDTSPQLGGDLDVQSSKITTATSNGNVKIEPNGTGVVEVRGAGGNDGKLQLNCSAQSHGIILASPAHSSGQSYTLIFPDNQIAADKYIKIKSISGSGSTAIGQAEYASLDANDLGEGTIPSGRFGTDTIATDALAAGALPTDVTIGASNINTHAVSTNAIADDAVTYAKIQNVSATDRLLGRDSSGAGIVEEIAPSAVRTMLGLATSATTDTTNASNISSGTLAAARVATLNQDTTGNAATATALETARTIAGVSFDGTGNISLNNNAITNGAGYITTVADTTIAPSTIDMEDNEKIKLGTGDDLQLYHDGNNSVIEDTGTGSLIAKASTFHVKSTGGEDVIKGITDGAVELYYDNAEKLSTTSGGGELTGTWLPASDATGNFGSSSKRWGTVYATAFSGSGASLTSLPAGNLTGTLPAIDGSNLTGISAGATGGGSDEIFYENGQTVTTDYTITNGKNAMSAGPITINSGVTVTVGSGETLTIV